MIRQLREEDRPAMVQLLQQAPAYNLYQLGNLETIGFGADYCAFWGDIATEGRLRACANLYMAGWSAYGEADAEWPALAALIDVDEEAVRLQDNPGGIPSILPLLTRAVVANVEEQLMVLHAEAFCALAPPQELIVRRAAWSDLAALEGLYAEAGDMRRSRQAIERPMRDGLIYVGRLREPRGGEGALVTAALTNAQTADSAMIGGVYTHKASRGHGYSQAVCSALCGGLLRMQMTPCLYWKTPAAGHVYRKLGFTPIGRWRSVWLGAVR